MSHKFRFFLFFFILFIFILFGWITVGDKSTTPFVSAIKSMVPEKVKTILKKTIFIIPFQSETIKRNKIKIKELEVKIATLNATIDFLSIENIGSNLLESREIKSNLNIYNIKNFKLPLMGRTPGVWTKPVAYIEQTDRQIIIVSGKGEFFFFEKEDLKSDGLDIKSIKSNLNDLIIDKSFYSSDTFGIKDLLILDNKIFFSYTKEQTSNCYNTTIASSKIDFEYLKFSEFFSYEDCVSNDPKRALHAGGRMVSFKEGRLLLTTGDFHNRTISQDENSMFGKIISIDLETKNYEIVAMGIRNSQGLYYDKDRNIILFTDHGPKGGDEININFSPDNKIIENYGWPISSYGKHYDGQHRKEAPLNKSHKDYGFVEPIKYFVDSIGISEIIKVPDIFNKKSTNGFFVSALGYKNQMSEGDLSIHHVHFDEDFKKVVLEDVLSIGERIRDMILIEEKSIILLILEGIPAVGVLQLAN